MVVKKYSGNLCNRCGSTIRYAKTNRCVGCQKRYVKQSVMLKEDRKAQEDKECAICKNQMGQQPCYDEHPITKKFRGWLCHKCNKGLGFFNENPIIIFKAFLYVLINNIKG